MQVTHFRLLQVLSHKNLQIRTHNARGLGDITTRLKTIQWYYSKKADIIMTQETHSCIETENTWKKEWDGDIYFSHGTSSARGTCIFIKSHVQKEIHKIISDPNGRYIILDISIDGNRMTLASIYAPNDDSPDFFTEVRNKIESITNDDRLIGGDYNLVLDLLLDKKGGNRRTNAKSQQKVLEWMECTDLVDVWRHQHPDEQKFTWSRTRPTKIFCRLDFFLASNGICDRIKSSSITPGFNSDHSVVTVNIELNQTPRGKGYWKLNCSHLQDTNYIDLIKRTITETATINQDANPNLLWDTIKMAVRGESIKYGASKKKNMNDAITKIEKEIQYLEEKLAGSTLSPEQIHLLGLKKIELDQIINEKAQGAYIRSRAQNYEEGERNSKYFFNIEKRNSYKKSINKLKIANSTITDDQNIILEEMKSFYKSLYTKQPLQNGSEFLNNLRPPPNIPLDNENKLKQEIELAEINKAIKNMQPNKSPGEDGLPIEFYRVFWTDIKHLLFNSYKYSLEIGSLSITQKRGVISLLPKKNDLALLKNWRPLTLLNVDYKILAKIIATRLKETLLHLIDQDQTGFLEKRFIGQNIASLIEVIDYCENNDLAAVLISIDFEKAFDKLDWDFLWKCMHFFKIPENIISWVKTLYSGSNSCVTNNGHMSDYFKLGRGVRQGCPLSPYLFIIAAEILAMSIRQNENIKGIIIGEKEIKIKQFADDSQMMSVYDKDSINATIKNVLDFGSVSGSTINYDKSADILRIGSVRNTDVELSLDYRVAWTNGPIEILGIDILASLIDTTNLNYSKVATKINSTIQVWSSQKLTLFGRISIINSVLLSKLIYRLSSLPTPNAETIKRIEDQLLGFLWKNKRHAIAKSMITNERDSFGLKFPCIATKDKAMKIAWIKRLISNHASIISPFLDKTLLIDLHVFFECNIKFIDIEDCWRCRPSIFWIDVLKAWCDVNYCPIDEVKNPNEEVIWMNSNIKVNGKVLFYRNMYEVGILRIKDLKTEHNNFLSFNELVTKHPGIRTNFVQYNGIISAIPLSYKRPNLPVQLNRKIIDVIKSNTKVPKKIYRIYNQKEQNFPHKAYEKHTRFFVNLTRETYEEAFAIMYSCTRSNKLRDFQYRLLHMTLTTNKEAFHYFKLVPNDRCTFCKSCQENIHHIILYCKFSKVIWMRLQAHFHQTTGVNIILSDQDIMFGNNSLPFNKLYNHIILFTKQYIYACRCLGETPDFSVLLRKLKLEYYIETKMSFNGVDNNDVLKKWEPFFPP